jgi:hypothetical protein
MHPHKYLLPICIRGGRPEILHIGSPCLHNEIVRILGATYMFCDTSENILLLVTPQKISYNVMKLLVTPQKISYDIIR